MVLGDRVDTMSFPSGPEHASYVALCRELRLERERGFELGDWWVWLTLEDPPILVDEGFLRTVFALIDLQIWIPRLDQLLAMLEVAGVRDVGFWAFDDRTKCGVLTAGDFDGISYGDLETAPTREEAALRLWMAVSERIGISEWTDEEWIATMRHFPSDAPRDVVERWVAERRAAPGPGMQP